MWTDTYDDTSKVYVPPGGLVGVEVSGGEVRLLPGETKGWIASEVIDCPDGYRYDHILLEADVPGSSCIKISVLNATADASEMGFANETVPSYRLREGTNLDVRLVMPSTYPKVRVQVNLVADGADSPRLLATTMTFSDVEEWRDEFLSDDKMSDFRGINLTDGTLELNLSRQAGQGGQYDPYPTIITLTYVGIGTFYANPGRTGYDDAILASTTSGHGAIFDDVDLDGNLDLVLARRMSDSKICWGDGSGTWSPTGATDLSAGNAYRPETGDFDGDGDVDVVFACYAQGVTSSSTLFLSNGGRNFNHQPSLTWTNQEFSEVSTGDLNGDGYDDILFSFNQEAIVYNGGIGGPDTTADVAFPVSSCYNNHIEDLDGDGYLDVLLGDNSNGKVRVFMGDSGGMDTQADYSLSISGYPTTCNAGDINGDGYVDLFYVSGGYGSYTWYIFEGASSGWSDASVHTVITTGYIDKVEVLDIDLDGYEDLVSSYLDPGIGGYFMKLYMGGSTWPTSADITKTNGGWDLAVAVPKGTAAHGVSGTFISESIVLPSTGKRWDLLHLDGTLPDNTSVSLTVQDLSGTPIPGYDGLEDLDVDLWGIDPERYGVIRVRVDVASEFNTTTPVLERIFVRWMDVRTWRDQFYGQGKVERLLNLKTENDMIAPGRVGGDGPQLVFSCLVGDEDALPRSRAFFDSGALDYLSWPPLRFPVGGASAVDVTDVNGDGYLDVAFAVHQTAAGDFVTKSPLFMGSPLGVLEAPQHSFDTLGAKDVLLRDLDDDGYIDVVFAQERKDTEDYDVRSVLYWGSADGWSDEPDVEFDTPAAQDVEATDLDGDGLMDLVFACYRGASTSTADGLVFMQSETGFNVTIAHRLPTKGAKRVASGDLNGDSQMDLVFANSFSSGFAEIDSYVYWGKAGGGYDPTPTGLPTKGASAVLVTDLDDDTDLDIVFANHWDDRQDLEVGSAVYLNDGSGGFGSSPYASLPTTGATGIAVADLDGTGWKDLVFSCQQNASTFKAPSLVYLGGASGWSTSADIRLPTEGASGVVATHLVEHGAGGYLSRPIILDHPPRATGTVHTFRYTVTLGPAVSGRLMLVDQYTWEALAEIPLRPGTNELDVRDAFRVKEHPRIRVMAVVLGLESGQAFSLDDLWLNWTERILVPPEVLDLTLGEPSVYRTRSVDLWVNTTDDYDLPGELNVLVEHRLNGTGTWDSALIDSLSYNEALGSWTASVSPKVNIPLGIYDFRVTASDLDNQQSAWREFPAVLEILNNPPTAPKVRISPERALSTSALRLEFDERATDIEAAGLVYHFTWLRDGEVVAGLEGDNVPSFHTAKGQNWSVEVRAFDGDEEGPPAPRNG
jgi:hypothetical protein